MPKNRRNDSKTHSIALSGLLFALAMALSFIEGTLVIPGLLPGMKLGLANIVVMYALFLWGRNRRWCWISSRRSSFFGVRLDGGVPLAVRRSALAFGDVAAVLSFPVRPTWYILSVCGALAHNIGQLLGAGVILSTAVSLYYAPVMLVLGLAMGALTSVTLRAILPALGRLGYNTHEHRGE